MPPSSIDASEPPLEDGLANQPIQRTDGATGDVDPDLLTDGEWIIMFKDALKAASEYQQTTLRGPWSRNYRAFNNRHIQGSKYDTIRYKNRSKLFKPKTRMAVRKNDATAASALFSTADVVSIKAELESDLLQVMTARFIGAALNYRLDRATKMTGPNWFLTAVGARQDAQITGVCVSKQYWQFEEREYDVIVDRPKIDPGTGLPAFDPVTGEDITEEDIEKEREIIIDRLMIDLVPAEMAFVDTTADWRDPIQSGGYFFAAYPVRKHDAETMISENAARPRMGGGKWRQVDIKKLTQGRAAEARRNDAVRRSREDGQDRYESRFSDRKGDIIWLYECFYRYNGEDWHYWMLGETILLSDPQPTRDAYPEQKGDRPYVMGLGALETHKTHPMAPVESWMPLQMEMNDITNLTLDSQKMSISPITKIVRGRNIDFKQVQNRGPDAMIMVEKEDDVTFDRAPPPTGSEQIQMNNLNVDFDELAGVFSTGSVQTNRQLNETVGGMQMMAGSSNALTEFDLRVWAETWAEPCLRQCVRVIQYYESSELVIGLAGKKAGLIIVPEAPVPEPGPLDQPPNPDEPPLPLEQVLENLNDAQISVRVNVGIGALDPKQKLEKFGMGVKMTMELGPLLDASGIMPNGPEMMNEVWGLLGYKDAERFFKPKPPDSGEPPPEVQKIMLEMELAKAKGELAAKAQQEKIAAEQEKHRLEMAGMMEQMKQDRAEFMLEMQRSREEMRAKQAMSAIDVQAKREGAAIDAQVKLESAAIDRENSQADHAMQREHAESDHEMAQRHADEAAAQKAKAMKTAAAAKPKPSGGTSR